MSWTLTTARKEGKGGEGGMKGRGVVKKHGFLYHFVEKVFLTSE